MKTIFLAFCVCGVYLVNAQPALHIGDSVPDITFNNIMHEEVPKADLKEHKSKLIILDFWATWCGSCIEQFPHMMELQSTWKNQVQIILVNSPDRTKDTPEKIGAFFKERGYHSLTSVTVDSTVNVLFPHREVPHYVWIKDGVVKAITEASQLTNENIMLCLKDPRFSLPIKKDFDPYQPLFINTQSLSIGPTESYAFFSKGNIQSSKSFITTRRSGNRIFGITISNMPLLEMYRRAINGRGSSVLFNEKRTILEVSDSSLLSSAWSRDNEKSWARRNLYTCDLILPINTKVDIYEYLLSNLNLHSNYYGRIEKRPTNCLVLVQGARLNETTINKGSKRITKNVHIASLVVALNNLSQITLPVLDESGSNALIDIEFPFEFKFLEQYNAFLLERFGLTLVETERELDMFVLTEKNYTRNK